MRFRARITGRHGGATRLGDDASGATAELAGRRLVLRLEGSVDVHGAECYRLVSYPVGRPELLTIRYQVRFEERMKEEAPS